MSRKYYSLVSGLPNITLEDSKLSYGPSEFFRDMEEYAIPEHFELFRLFNLNIDNRNIFKGLVKHEHTFQEGGLYSPDEVEDILSDPNDTFPYITEFVEEYRSEVFDQEVDKKRLMTLYYQYLLSHENRFIRKWFELELNLKNIIAAMNARKHGNDIAHEVVNANDLSELLLKNSSRDFGIGGSFEYIEQILTVFDEPDLLKREKSIDLIKWEWLDDNTFFDYFTIEKLIAFYIKLRMIERWISLDPETGKEMFEKLTRELERGFELPDEFNKNKI